MCCNKPFERNAFPFVRALEFARMYIHTSYFHRIQIFMRYTYIHLSVMVNRLRIVNWTLRNKLYGNANLNATTVAWKCLLQNGKWRPYCQVSVCKQRRRKITHNDLNEYIYFDDTAVRIMCTVTHMPTCWKLSFMISCTNFAHFKLAWHLSFRHLLHYCRSDLAAISYIWVE